MKDLTGLFAYALSFPSRWVIFICLEYRLNSVAGALRLELKHRLRDYCNLSKIVPYQLGLRAHGWRSQQDLNLHADFRRLLEV